MSLRTNAAGRVLRHPRNEEWVIHAWGRSNLSGFTINNVSPDLVLRTYHRIKCRFAWFSSVWLFNVKIIALFSFLHQRVLNGMWSLIAVWSLSLSGLAEALFRTRLRSDRAALTYRLASTWIKHRDAATWLLGGYNQRTHEQPMKVMWSILSNDFLFIYIMFELFLHVLIDGAVMWVLDISPIIS
jgi:hypothetical protein